MVTFTLRMVDIVARHKKGQPNENHIIISRQCPRLDMPRDARFVARHVTAAILREKGGKGEPTNVEVSFRYWLSSPRLWQLVAAVAAGKAAALGAVSGAAGYGIKKALDKAR